MFSLNDSRKLAVAMLQHIVASIESLIDTDAFQTTRTVIDNELLPNLKDLQQTFYRCGFDYLYFWVEVLPEVLPQREYYRVKSFEDRVVLVVSKYPHFLWQGRHIKYTLAEIERSLVSDSSLASDLNLPQAQLQHLSREAGVHRIQSLFERFGFQKLTHCSDAEYKLIDAPRSFFQDEHRWGEQESFHNMELEHNYKDINRNSTQQESDALKQVQPTLYNKEKVLEIFNYMFVDIPESERDRKNQELRELLSKWQEEDSNEQFKPETHNAASSPVIKQAELEATFIRLAEQWRRETYGVSSSTKLAVHPAYQEIISLGEPVVPLLLKELERRSGRWFSALHKITGEDPVLPEFRGRTQEMIKAWLAWGRAKGYQW